MPGYDELLRVREPVERVRGAVERVPVERVLEARVPLRVVVLAAVVRVLAFVIGRAAARLETLLLVDPLRAALAGLLRAGVRGVVRAGTDLPPSRSITVVLFHERH